MRLARKTGDAIPVRRRQTTAAALLLACVPPLHAGEPAAGPGSLASALDAQVMAAVRHLELPSLSVAVLRGDEVVYAGAHGLADVENGVPATTASVYRVGSVTKHVTAAAILRLAETGRLRLDDEVARYVPRLNTQGYHVTLRHLLNHTSGIRSFTEVPSFRSKERLDLTDDEMLAAFHDEPFDFAPGSNFLYNNSGYYLLSMVVERATGRRYADVVREDLLGPLGLQATRECSDAELIPHRARGYTRAAGALRNAPFISLRPPRGGGDLCSTATELARWMRALSGGRVVSPRSFATMTAPGTLADGRSLAYGAGLFLARSERGPEIFHGGGIAGFTAYLSYLPEADLIVVALTNSDAAHLYDGHLGRQLARRVLGIVERPSAPAEVPEQELARVSGVYRLGSASVALRGAGGRLVLEGESTIQQLYGATFLPAGGGTFLAAEDPELALHFSDERPRAERMGIVLSGAACGDAVRAAPIPDQDR